VVVLAVLLRSTTWCMPHLGVSCINHNSSRIGSITHNFNRNNFSCNNSRSSNSSSSTVPLTHHHSRLPSCHHSSFPPTTFHASTVERWVTSLGNAACPSRAALRELRRHGKPTEGPSEGSCTTGGPCQLHHHGGDSHVRRSSSRYILPQ
jgi:hypothetical protein